MKTYQEMVREYKKRQRDTLVDTLSTGLAYMDEIAVDTGLLEETGLLAELTGAVTSALPFMIIAVTEGTKAILGRKPGKTATRDSMLRMAKTGTAMGVGAAVTMAAGFWAAIPVTMGVRALFDRYRSKSMTGRRVSGRIERLHELNKMIRHEETVLLPETEETQALPQDAIAAAGTVV